MSWNKLLLYPVCKNNKNTNKKELYLRNSQSFLRNLEIRQEAAASFPSLVALGKNESDRQCIPYLDDSPGL